MEGSYRFISGHSFAVEGKCQSHNHTCFEVVYHPTGCGTTCTNKRDTIEFREGSAVIYAPYVYHDQIMSVPGVDVILCIDADTVAEDLPESWYIPEVLDPYLLQEFRLLSEAAPSRSTSQQQILDYRASAVLLTLFRMESLHSMQANSPSDYYAERASQYLRRHYQTLAHVDEIAAALNISPSYLRSIYRQRFGTSLIRSLTSLRVERAQELLRNPAMTLAAIADDCGFANERYLSTVFKKNVGCTPGQFRRQLMLTSVDV